MLERMVRKGPVALRQTLPASIEDLEWTADALSAALLALQEKAAGPLAGPAGGSELAATRPS
jgi:hypothetical protein